MAYRWMSVMFCGATTSKTSTSGGDLTVGQVHHADFIVLGQTLIERVPSGERRLLGLAHLRHRGVRADDRTPQPDHLQEAGREAFQARFETLADVGFGHSPRWDRSTWVLIANLEQDLQIVAVVGSKSDAEKGWTL